MFPILFKLAHVKGARGGKVGGQRKLFVLCNNPGPGCPGHIPPPGHLTLVLKMTGEGEGERNNKMSRAGPLYLIKITLGFIQISISISVMRAEWREENTKQNFVSFKEL